MGPNARLAQWESACLTRRWSQVQILHRALSGPERGGAGAGGRRHEPARGGAPPFRTARRPPTGRTGAPGIETPLRAGGALRRVPMHQCLLLVKGGRAPGRAPLSHFPPGHAGVEPEVRRHLFSRARRYTGGPNAHRRPRRSAGTAWNADLRSAPRPAGPRTAHRRPRKSAAGPGNADLRSAQRAAGPRAVWSCSSVWRASQGTPTSRWALPAGGGRTASGPRSMILSAGVPGIATRARRRHASASGDWVKHSPGRGWPHFRTFPVQAPGKRGMRRRSILLVSVNWTPDSAWLDMPTSSHGSVVADTGSVQPDSSSSRTRPAFSKISTDRTR